MLSRITPLLVAACASLAVLGCGSGTPAPPPGAVRPPDPHPPIDANKTWTLQDKIDAVNKSAMSADQKKQKIAELQAAGK